MKKRKIFNIRIANMYEDVYLQSFSRESCDFTTTEFSDDAYSFSKEVEAARFCNEFSKKLPFGFTLYYESDFILTH